MRSAEGKARRSRCRNALGWALLLAVGILPACSPLFVLRASYEQAKILARREPIARLTQDPSVPAERRAKLELVLEVREFAADSLELNVGESYTTFSQLDADTFALLLSAARQDRFEPHTWWFPVVGSFPYRAYFSERSLQRAVEDLNRRGYDAYVRPIAAFSTLGWFNDPLLSPLLRHDSISLANTVIHELFHNTLFIPGRVMFNESLANFVGARGAIAFFCSDAAEERRCQLAEAAWQDELLFSAFLSGVVDELETLYAREDLTLEETLAAREVAFARARESFENELRPRLRVLSFAEFTRHPLNNAFLIARRVYFERLDLFEAVYQASGQELLFAIQRMMRAAREEQDDPFAAVERLLVPGPPGEGQSGAVPARGSQAATNGWDEALE